jgi:hypothetical protein
MNSWNAHKRNTGFALAYAGAILLLVLVMIVPQRRLMARQANEIAALEAEIAREKTLLPIYKQLEKEKAQCPPLLLPHPSRCPLGRDEAGRITSLLEDASRRSGMNLVSAVPDINSLTETGRFLSVAMALSGEFKDFQTLLTLLGEISCIWQIEKIRIAPGPAAREYQLTVWIGVEGRAPAEESPKEPAKEPAKKPAGNRT